MKVICFYFTQEIDPATLGDIFYRYTPQVAFRGKQALFLEVSQCSKLYSAENILKRGLVHLKQLSLNASAAIADDVPTALALAVYKKNVKTELPVEALSLFASPFRQN